MNEFNINLVGKEANIKKEEIFNNFDFNNIPINNLPVSYFPLNNLELSNELKNKTIDSNINTSDFTDVANEIKISSNIIYFQSSNNFQITKDIYVDLILVGGGGGGGNGDVINQKYGGGGGGGEVIHLTNYKLKTGIYNINIGEGGNANSNGNPTYLMKEKDIFIKARGGNKGNTYEGGLSYYNDNLGKGADGDIKEDNAKLGKIIDNKYYGNGGLLYNSEDKTYDTIYTEYGEGGKGGNKYFIVNLKTIVSTNLGKKGKNGVIILNYKDYDNFQYIKKIANSSSKIINTSNAIIETASDDSNYKIIKYTNSGTLLLNNDIECDILLVGGGGGGGKNAYGYEGGGGGGGGGVGYGKNIILSKDSYTITIGNGGAGGTGEKETPVDNQGKNGNNTTISNSTNSLTMTANGGGGGGVQKGSSGGCGGGSGGDGQTNLGGTATRGLANGFTLDFYGNDGGTAETSTGGGGGGGAGSKGQDTKINSRDGGYGGDGIGINITGSIVYYGAGGGGCRHNDGGNNGIGGKGGGGNGGRYDYSKPSVPKQATDGATNTGSGGGGGGHTNYFYKNTSVEKGDAGNGGSGIVIIRVKKEYLKEKKSLNDITKIIDRDTRIINDVKDEFRKKIKIFENNEMPYNKFYIIPLLILILLVWMFIFLFLLKFIHHYLASIYLYILIIIIIFLLFFGSLWFLYSNNDL